MLKKKKIPTEKFAISEIFSSIQGESSYSGRYCFFIRLAGCNLRCSWCDSNYAFSPKYYLSTNEILTKAKKSLAKIAEITGGEPLLHSQTPELCRKLLDIGFDVLLETNGSIPITNLPEKVKIIMDCKCPSSGEHKKMYFANFAKISKKDEIKFVIANKEDYNYAKKIIRKYNLFEKTDKIFFSPVAKSIKYSDLASWMIKDKISAIFAVQLHKIIWGKNVKGK